MIGGINKEQDFYVFLTNQEIELLDTKTLEGMILDFEENIPYPLKLSVNDAKTAGGHRRPFNGNIVIEGFETRTNYQMFLSTDYFEKLKEYGDIGGRYGYGKADIVKMSRAENDDDFKYVLRHIKRCCPVTPGNF